MMRAQRQAGFTLVELMIAMALGLIVSLAAMTLMMTSQTAYQTIDEQARLEENTRFVLEMVGRAVHQAGYVNWDRPEGPFLPTAAMSPSIQGLDNSTLPPDSTALQDPRPSTVNGSDVLAVRFFGAGKSDQPDGTMLDCAGYAISEPASKEDAERDTPGKGRGWSIFYVHAPEDGEPQLRCKYYHENSWHTAILADGVESFQVLYGVDTQGDAGYTFLDATAMNVHDAQVRNGDGATTSYWKQVYAVRVALLLRGNQNLPGLADNTDYTLFSRWHAKQAAASDHASIRHAALPPETRQRLRKVASATFTLRNRPQEAAE